MTSDFICPLDCGHSKDKLFEKQQFL